MTTLDKPAMVDSVSPKPPLGPRAVRMLRQARMYWSQDSERLAATQLLTDEQRVALRPVVRQWDVRVAAGNSTRLRYADWPLFAVTSVAVLVLPFVAVMVFAPTAPALTSSNWPVAAATYLSMLCALFAGRQLWLAMTLLLTAHMARFRRVLAQLGWVGSAILLVTALVAVAVGPADWPTMRFALFAGLATLPVGLVAYTTIGVYGSYLATPWFNRWVGTMPTSRVVAARLWNLLDEFEKAHSTWCQAPTRRELLAQISLTTSLLEGRSPREMWFAGYRGSGHSEAVRRYRRAASFTRSLGWRVVDAGKPSDFESIHQDLVKAIVALAGGEWEPLPPVGEPTGTSKVAAIGRRLMSLVILGAAALLIPHLPGLTLTEAGVTTLQVALFGAAVLSLTPRDAAQERILGGFGEGQPR
jgi:hypothetical protein